MFFPDIAGCAVSRISMSMKGKTERKTCAEQWLM